MLAHLAVFKTAGFSRSATSPDWNASATAHRPRNANAAGSSARQQPAAARCRSPTRSQPFARRGERRFAAQVESSPGLAGAARGLPGPRLEHLNVETLPDLDQLSRTAREAADACAGCTCGTGPGSATLYMQTVALYGGSADDHT